MPLLKLETAVVLSEEKRTALLSSLSNAVARTIGKPEQYMMVTMGTAAIVMSGKPGDAAFVDVLAAYPGWQIIMTFDVAETRSGHDRAALIEKRARY